MHQIPEMMICVFPFAHPLKTLHVCSVLDSEVVRAQAHVLEQQLTSDKGNVWPPLN